MKPKKIMKNIRYYTILIWGVIIFFPLTSSAQEKKEDANSCIEKLTQSIENKLENDFTFSLENAQLDGVVDVTIKVELINNSINVLEIKSLNNSENFKNDILLNLKQAKVEIDKCVGIYYFSIKFSTIDMTARVINYSPR